MKSISEWQRTVHALAVANGWYDSPVTFSSYIANFHGEVSELWEAHRRKYLNDSSKVAGLMITVLVQAAVKPNVEFPTSIM